MVRGHGDENGEGDADWLGFMMKAMVIGEGDWLGVMMMMVVMAMMVVMMMKAMVIG